MAILFYKKTAPERKPAWRRCCCSPTPSL